MIPKVRAKLSSMIQLKRLKHNDIYIDRINMEISAAAPLLIRNISSPQSKALRAARLQSSHHHRHHQVSKGLVRNILFVHQFGRSVE
jgi:hypothetical protein